MDTRLFTLLLAGLVLFGCTGVEPEKQTAFTGSSLFLYVSEKTPAGTTVFQLENKMLTTGSKFGNTSREISFIELLAVARTVNESGYFNATPTEKCTDCPEYEFKVRLMDRERFEIYRTYRLSPPAEKILSTLRSLSDVPECKAASDCVRDGCSGQYCQPYRKPGTITTCEFKPEYACYNEAGCGCFQGKCGWSPDVLSCVETRTETKSIAPEEVAKALCVRECISRLSTGEDLRLGPCLSDAIAPGWACDIAHDPREPVDDRAPFSCPVTTSGKPYRLVELDGTCGVLNVR